MKIIFLGLMYSEKSLKLAYKEDKVRVQVAPQVFQDNLIKGFNENQTPIKVLNVPPTGSFPKNNRRLFFKKMSWGRENVQIGFINLPFIKHAIQKRKLYKEILRELKKDADVGIVLYTMHKPFLEAVKRVKKKYPDVHVSVIQTDPVPGRGEVGRADSNSRIKKGDKLISLAKCCDSFILLTDYLKDAVECGNRPYIVMESVCNSNAAAVPANQKSNNICLYTGTLHSAYGIVEIVEAFKLCPEAQLWICGGGNSEQYIKENSQKHDNIKFFGFVGGDEIKKLQTQADFMINPRRPTGTFTKYSFPSKTVEYMVTAKPTIMYKLEGVPDEYDKYLNYLSGESGAEIAGELKNIFSQNYQSLLDKALLGREFVLSEKSPKVQAKKIIKLLKTNK